MLWLRRGGRPLEAPESAASASSVPASSSASRSRRRSARMARRSQDCASGVSASRTRTNPGTPPGSSRRRAGWRNAPGGASSASSSSSLSPKTARTRSRDIARDGDRRAPEPGGARCRVRGRVARESRFSNRRRKYNCILYRSADTTFGAILFFSTLVGRRGPAPRLTPRGRPLALRVAASFSRLLGCSRAAGCSPRAPGARA